MKNFFQTSWKLAPALLLLLAGSAMTASAQSPRLQIDQLDVLANKASQTVDIKLDERMLQITWKFFGNDPDEAKIKDVIKGLKGIYVKNFSFEKEGEYSQAEVESVMSQLRAGSWSKIVTIKSKRASENLEVYLSMTGDVIGGLAVISFEPKELTVVNIVGAIDLDKLSSLEGQFGVPDLGIEKQPKKKN